MSVATELEHGFSMVAADDARTGLIHITAMFCDGAVTVSDAVGTFWDPGSESTIEFSEPYLATSIDVTAGTDILYVYYY